LLYWYCRKLRDIVHNTFERRLRRWKSPKKNCVVSNMTLLLSFKSHL
jgi:hypothetical protein